MKTLIDHPSLLPASAKASHAHPTVSARYGFVPTETVIESFEDDGWTVTRASETKSRRPEYAGFQRHLIRMSPPANPLLQSIDERLEVCIVNSHDGNTSMRFVAGVIRFACANGLLVADSTVPEIRLSHSALTLDGVLHAGAQMREQLEQVGRVINDWKRIPTTLEQRTSLAEAGIRSRWGPDLTLAPVEPWTLLNRRRQGDAKDDLWSVFNVIQENLIKGNVSSPGRINPLNGKSFRSTRSLIDLYENARVNQELWHEASLLALAS